MEYAILGGDDANSDRFDRDPDCRNAGSAGRRAGTLPRPARTPPPPAQKGLPPGPGAEGLPPRAQGQKGAPPPQAQQPPAPARPRPIRRWPSLRPSLTPTRASRHSATTSTAIAQKKERAALAKLVLVKDFFWLKEDGNAAAKDRHRGARDRAQPRREGRLGLGNAERARLRRDRRALSGPPEYGVLAVGPAVQGRGPGEAGRRDQDRHRRLG